jgi:hypothetical protein
METNDFGIVYLFENPAMPGLIKIGITLRGDAQTRMSELYSTGVPVPFNCVYSAKVKDPEKVERALHNAFGPNRINPKREFFEIEAGQAIGIIKLLQIQEITTQVIQQSENDIDLPSRQAAERLIKRRPRFNFIEMQIPIGSEIVFISTGETARVFSENAVLFRNEEMSLTKATKIALDYDYNIAPGTYWSFNGRRLRAIYNDTYHLPEQIVDIQS